MVEERTTVESFARVEPSKPGCMKENAQHKGEPGERKQSRKCCGFCRIRLVSRDLFESVEQFEALRPEEAISINKFLYR